MATEINRMSQVVEDAVNELIRIFLQKSSTKEEESEPSIPISATGCKSLFVNVMRKQVFC